MAALGRRLDERVGVFDGRHVSCTPGARRGRWRCRRAGTWRSRRPALRHALAREVRHPVHERAGRLLVRGVVDPLRERVELHRVDVAGERLPVADVREVGPDRRADRVGALRRRFVTEWHDVQPHSPEIVLSNSCDLGGGERRLLLLHPLVVVGLGLRDHAQPHVGVRQAAVLRRTARGTCRAGRPRS